MYEPLETCCFITFHFCLPSEISPYACVMYHILEDTTEILETFLALLPPLQGSFPDFSQLNIPELLTHPLILQNHSPLCTMY